MVKLVSSIFVPLPLSLPSLLFLSYVPLLPFSLLLLSCGSLIQLYVVLLVFLSLVWRELLV